MRFFPIRRSAPSTTALARRAWAIAVSMRGFNSTIFEEFQDILGGLFGFEEVLGGGRRRSGRGAARGQRGADLRYDMTLSFEEAAAGVTSKIRLVAPRIVRDLQRNWREARDGHVHLPHLRRARADVVLAGIFLDHAHVPGLPGRGANDQGRLHHVPRPGTHRARA